MTEVELLDALKEFVEQETSDIKLYIPTEYEDQTPQTRVPEVHLMNLPRYSEVGKRCPWIVLQFLNGTDAEETIANIRIVVCVWDTNRAEGMKVVLNVLVKLRLAILKHNFVVGNKFYRTGNVESMVYEMTDDDDNPDNFHVGELLTTWVLPNLNGDY